MAKRKTAKKTKKANKTTHKKTAATKPAKKLANKTAKKPAKQAAKPKPAVRAKPTPAKAAKAPPAVAAPVASTPPIIVVAPTAVPVVSPPVAPPAAPAAPKGKAAKAAKTPSLTNQRKAALDAKTIPDLRSMLKKNDQITTGTKGKLVKRILDCVANGALPRCPSCGLGRLKASKYSGFRCPGGYDDDEYVFCGFTANVGEIERPAWQFETPGLV
ncbi:MAG TPA: hypothetical protein VIV11_38035 [Kofleriaceae bacterium]